MLDLTIKQVWVIQCRSTGSFLTQELHFSRSLRSAGRLYDKAEAVETAHSNLDDDYEIHTFFEVEQLQSTEFRFYG